MFSTIALAAGLFLLPAGQAPQPATAKLSRAEQEEFLRTAKMVARRPIGKGVTQSARVTLERNGFRHDGHFQTVEITKKEFPRREGVELNFKDSFQFNVAAYELARIIGIDDMLPPTIQRRLSGTTGALTWWVDDVVMDEEVRLKKKLQPPEPTRWNHEIQIVRVFDQLIGNTDRNLGNLLITKDWEIWMIDHTRAFRPSKALLRPGNVTGCDRSMLARMRELNSDVLKERLGRALTRTEIAGLLARRDEIVKILDAAVKQNGEEAVLFDRPKRD